MNRAICQWLALVVCAVVVACFTLTTGYAASKAVDLDANPTNGAESQCDLNVLQTFPVMIENRVTNRSGRDAFSFSWPSAGPGGFTSSVPAGTTSGVGATWVWTTNQSIFAFTGNECANDICFSRTSGPDPIPGTCSLCTDDGVAFTIARGPGAGETTLSWQGGQGPYTLNRSVVARTIGDPASALLTTDQLRVTDTPPAGTIVFYQVRAASCVLRKSCSTNADCFAPTDGTCVSRGPFGVPGRSLSSSNVTVSAASLTSSLITFFSPGTEVFRLTSTAGPGGVSDSWTNMGSHTATLTIPAYPPGCCPANPYVPHQLRCGDVCVDYLNDSDNCGACDNVCGEGTSCTNGSCELPCDKGQVDCFGECVWLDYDDNNCGACGNVCGENECCMAGICTPPCAEDRAYCGYECADLRNDRQNCGACGNVCLEGSCCQGSECVPLECDYPSTPFDWDLCGDQCVQTEVDDDNCGACGNACGEGECCHGKGGCGNVCGDDTQCGDQCADLDNDSANCGVCGNVCEEGSCCLYGECALFECEANEALCDEGCVDVSSDPGNCGECGYTCKGCCIDGICDPYGECGEPPSPHPPATCPNSNPTSPSDFQCLPQAGALPATCPNEGETWPEGSQCDTKRPAESARVVHAAPGGGSIDAPFCETEPTLQSIEPGQTTTTCTSGGPLFKEVPTALTVCGVGLPGVDGRCGSTGSLATTGTFNRLVADPTTSVGNAYVTPYRVHVIGDTSNDGLLQPGESASLVIETLNAGPMDITSATATLSAPAVDLSDDGIENLVGITVDGGPVSYGTIPGTPAATTCAPTTLHPASNTPAIPIAVPAGHSGDTGHPAILSVSGIVNGQPFSMDVPFTLGIADGCDPEAHTRDFDGLVGLLTPMAGLVPMGETVRFPAHSFVPGQNRTLRLKQTCGTTKLSDDDVDPPQIVGLSEAVRGPIDLSTLWDERQQAYTTLFGWDPQEQLDRELADLNWVYVLRTTGLGRGTYTLTIRLAGRKDYVTGFVLN